MTIILRLDPTLPMVWRSPDEIQFGVPAAAVLSPAEPWQQRLLVELVAGMPESALMVWAEMLRVDPVRVRALLSTLSPALLRVDPDLVAAAPNVLLHSARAANDARLLSALRGVFADAGIAVTEHSDFDVDAAASTPTSPPTVAVVLAHFTVNPRFSAALLSHDVTHLPIVIDGAGVRVGPLVVPGATGCLHCAELYRIDKDPSWPVLATQLLEQAAPAPSALLALEAAASAARLITTAPHAMPGAASQNASLSITVRAKGARRVWHRHRPHPSCGCLSLEETVTALARPERPNLTTTAKAIRVPA